MPMKCIFIFQSFNSNCTFSVHCRNYTFFCCVQLSLFPGSVQITLFMSVQIALSRQGTNYISLWQCTNYISLWQCTNYNSLWQCTNYISLWQCTNYISLWQCTNYNSLWQCTNYNSLCQCTNYISLCQCTFFACSLHRPNKQRQSRIIPCYFANLLTAK